MISKNFFSKLTHHFDIEQLKTEVDDVINMVGYKHGQISLVHRREFKDDCWFDGVGSPLQFDENRNPKVDNNGNLIRRFTEEEFNCINPTLEGSEIEHVYNILKEEYNVTRYRIAKISAKSCYGWHKDQEVRVHVPVYTSPGSFVITDDGIASHLPDDGSSYLFHANNGYHTAINSDYKKDRVHLLINIW